MVQALCLKDSSELERVSKTSATCRLQTAAKGRTRIALATAKRASRPSRFAEVRAMFQVTDCLLASHLDVSIDRCIAQRLSICRHCLEFGTRLLLQPRCATLVLWRLECLSAIIVSGMLKADRNTVFSGAQSTVVSLERRVAVQPYHRMAPASDIRTPSSTREAHVHRNTCKPRYGYIIPAYVLDMMTAGVPIEREVTLGLVSKRNNVLSLVRRFQFMS